MLRRSLAIKIFLYALISFPLLTAAGFWAVNELLREDMMSVVRQGLEVRAAFIAREVARLGPPSPATRARLAELAEGMGVELRYVPWSRSERYPAELQTQSVLAVEPRPEGDHRRRYWVRVEQDGQPIGALSVRFRSQFAGRAGGWGRSLLPLAALALVLIPPLAFWVIRPIRRLEQAVQRLAAGDLDTPVEVRRTDELGRLAAAFEEMRRRIKDVLHEKERLLVDVSHELRGPLSRVSLAQTLLEEDVGPKPYLDRIKQEVGRMDALVGELLELARGRVPAAHQQEPADLATLAEELLEERQLPLQQGGFRLDKALSPAPVVGDPLLLRRAMSNLIDNALKYTPPGGLLRVTSGRAGADVFFRVEDDGPGIPEGDLPHVFEPFYRPDAARSRQTGGTGLGLAIVKTVVERHGGRATLANRLGGGTVAEIRLPERPG